MYFRIILVSFLLSGTILLAQTNSGMALQDNSAITVHSKGLPENFRLFIADTVSQILYNPSRGGDYNNSFVLASYLTNSTPIIIGASLFNFMDSKWLLTFSNYICQGNLTSSSSQELDDLYNLKYYNIRLDNTSINDIDKNLFTTIKLAKIGRAGFGNYSIGLYGLINYYKTSGYRLVSQSDTNFNGGTSYYTKEIQAIEGNTNTSTRAASYQVGAEITFAAKDWDLKFNLGYQAGYQNSKFNMVTKQSRVNTSYDSSYSPPYSSATSSLLVSNSNKNTEWNPGLIILNAVIHRRVSFITPLDNIFLSVNSYYSSTKFKSSSQYFYSSSYLNNPTFEKSVEGEKNDPVHIWGLDMNAGYAVKKNFSDFNFLSGLTISYSNYRHISFYANNEEGMEDVKLTEARFILPLYLDYHLTQWISFFGGINYYYFYGNQNAKYSSLGVDNQYLNYYIMQHYSGEEKVSTFRSSKTNYLGAELLHKSGLLLQISFVDDMANIKRWDLTLGYKFR